MILYKLHFFLCEFSVKRRYANGRHTSKKKVIFIKNYAKISRIAKNELFMSFSPQQR